MENNKTESWIWIVTFGFFIVICFIIAIIAIPMHISSLNEELAGDEDSLYYWRYTYPDWCWEYGWDYDSEQRESAIDLYTGLIDEKESEIESWEGSQKYLPFGIIIGVIIIFIGFLSKYYYHKDTAVISKKENVKEENVIEILNKRYAKGEITKREYEQMKKDILKEN
jgi:putative membrane protein